MGFSLYLNCRIELEGWDLEIAFKRLANNKSKNAMQRAVILAGILLILPVNLIAQDKLTEKTDNANSASSKYIYPDNIPVDTLNSILDSPDFGGEKDSWGIRLKPKAKEKKLPEFNTDFSPLLSKIRKVFALMLRVLLICLIVFLAVLSFFYIKKHRNKQQVFRKRGTVRISPETAEIDPCVLLKKSQEMFVRGDLRQAWGLCIAALFRRIEVYYGIKFPPGATEYDCMNVISNVIPAQEHILALPVNHWISYAYGGYIPTEDNYHNAISCCMDIAKTGVIYKK
jgi:hypothetical protein